MRYYLLQKRCRYRTPELSTLILPPIMYTTVESLTEAWSLGHFDFDDTGDRVQDKAVMLDKEMVIAPPFASNIEIIHDSLRGEPDKNLMQRACGQHAATGRGG